MDFNKFKDSGDNNVSNTFDGDENLNPYAGSMDNYFENHQGDDENGIIWMLQGMILLEEKSGICI